MRSCGAPARLDPEARRIPFPVPSRAPCAGRYATVRPGRGGTGTVPAPVGHSLALCVTSDPCTCYRSSPSRPRWVPHTAPQGAHCLSTETRTGQFRKSGAQAAAAADSRAPGSSPSSRTRAAEPGQLLALVRLGPRPPQPRSLAPDTERSSARGPPAAPPASPVPCRDRHLPEAWAWRAPRERTAGPGLAQSGGGAGTGREPGAPNGPSPSPGHGARQPPISDFLGINHPSWRGSASVTYRGPRAPGPGR